MHLRAKFLLFIYSLVILSVGAVSANTLRIYLTGSSYYVSGIVRQAPIPSPFLSGADPEGYYLESSVFGKVYLKHALLAQYNGQKISTEGKMDRVCGPDGMPCYPQLILEWLKPQRN